MPSLQFSCAWLPLYMCMVTIVHVDGNAYYIGAYGYHCTCTHYSTAIVHYQSNAGQPLITTLKAPVRLHISQTHAYTSTMGLPRRGQRSAVLATAATLQTQSLPHSVPAQNWSKQLTIP